VKFIFVALSLDMGIVISSIPVSFVLLSILMFPFGISRVFAVMLSRFIPIIICFTVGNFLDDVVYKTMSFFELLTY